MKRRLQRRSRFDQQIFDNLWVPVRSEATPGVWWVAGRRNFRAPIRQTFRFEFPVPVEVNVVRCPRGIVGFRVRSMRVEGVEQLTEGAELDAGLLDYDLRNYVKLDRGRVFELDIERLPGEASHDRVLLYVGARDETARVAEGIEL